MKIKIIILMILILISFNNVIGLEQTFIADYDTTFEDEFGTTGATNWNVERIYIDDIDFIEGFNFIVFTPNTWLGSSETSDYVSTTFYNDAGKTNVVGNGYVGFSKFADGKYRIQFWFIEFNDSLTGFQEIFWDNNGLKTMACYMSSTGKTFGDNHVRLGYTHFAYGSYYLMGNNYVQFPYYWINTVTYDYNINSETLDFDLDRSTTYTSRLIINDGNEELANETTLKSNDRFIFSQDLTNCTWDVNIYSSLEDNIYHQLNFCDFFVEIDENVPTLTTDKTAYNTSEQITISFTNLDKIENDGNSPVDLRSIIIMYPDIDSYTGYDKKYIYNLLYHEYEGNFTINTSFLSPQTDYILFACDNYDGILFEGDFFNVYPDDEYLSISCDADAGCITYNGIKNTIYYKINNNSDIIIKDNDNNIINTYHNIIGTGSIIYTIPDDIEHLNTYPNWKVYLNNTNYATSYNKNLEVYWSLFVSPTETPTPYPTDTPDINISDQLDNLTIEIQPLKELLYGFVYIVIDNPDYDKDNIIDENEINHWFNSLIPMCLLLLIIILYIGLKKNRD